MRLKTLAIVVAALAVLSAIVYVVRRPAPPPSADARLGQPLVAADTAGNAAKLLLSDQGKNVTLTRDDSGTWRVTNYYDLPADFSKLSRLVSDLTEAKIERLVTSNSERIGRLEFRDTKIELLDPAGKALAAVTLGKNADNGGRFVRFDSENKAYLASFRAWLDAEPKNWANAQLLNLKSEDIAKIEIPFAEGGAVTVSRAKKDDTWTSPQTPAGQQVKADKIASVLSSVGSLRFSDTTAPDDPKVAAAKAHLRTFTLTTFDGKTYAVALGRKPEEKKLKPPSPTADGKSGPAALGSLSDLAKKDAPATDGKSDAAASADAKPLEPEFETIPAGPVFAFVTSSDEKAPVNAMMQKRAFQIGDWTFTGLPQKRDELFEPAPAKPADSPKPPESAVGSPSEPAKS